MSRPKGSKNKKSSKPIKESKELVIKDKNTKLEEIEEETTVSINSKIKSLGICDLCNSDIIITPCTIRLTDLTSCASWHRICKLDRLTLCSKCAKELNDTIDKFIVKKNSKLKKFMIDEVID